MGDNCGAIFDTAKALMLLCKHFGFIECEIDIIFFREPLFGVVEMLPRQSFYTGSYIVGEADFPAAKTFLMSAIDGISTKQKIH